MQRILKSLQRFHRPFELGSSLCRSLSSSDCITAIDRASHFRRKNQWLQQPQVKKDASYIVFMGLRPVAENIDSEFSDLRMSRYRHEEVEKYLVGEEAGALEIFLGLEEGSQPLFLLALRERHADLLSDKRFVLEGYISVKPLVDRPLWVYSRSIVAWNYNHPFCSYCGSPTAAQDMGHKRICSSAECSSRKSRATGDHALAHPRSDPATIAVVTQGRSCLLARKDSFPPDFLSCIAGFVETGESLEEAVAREVFEEVGLVAASVRYVMSEPWPFDSVLMLGCHVEIDPNDSRPLAVDTEELGFADWFSVEDVQSMMSGTHRYTLPPRHFLAYRMLENWVRSITS